MAFEALSAEDRQRLLAALARSFHPEMEPQAVEYLLSHFDRALAAIGWTIQPMPAALVISTASST